MFYCSSLCHSGGHLPPGTRICTFAVCWPVGLLGNLVNRPNLVQNMFKFYLFLAFFLIIKNKLSSQIDKQNTIQDVIGFLIMISMSGTNALRITKAKCYPIIKKHFLSIQANIYFFLHPRHVCVPFPD